MGLEYGLDVFVCVGDHGSGCGFCLVGYFVVDFDLFLDYWVVCEFG